MGGKVTAVKALFDGLSGATGNEGIEEVRRRIASVQDQSRMMSQQLGDQLKKLQQQAEDAAGRGDTEGFARIRAEMVNVEAQAALLKLQTKDTLDALQWQAEHAADAVGGIGGKAADVGKKIHENFGIPFTSELDAVIGHVTDSLHVGGWTLKDGQWTLDLQ